ncbi:MAG TPA: hypothetical protein PKV29_09160, partial [Trichococcus flocculiformis]|nr:hypothetical protein [Trichococcus flocculiformis]
MAPGLERLQYLCFRHSCLLYFVVLANRLAADQLLHLFDEIETDGVITAFDLAGKRTQIDFQI